jgi:hypothetical protein
MYLLFQTLVFVAAIKDLALQVEGEGRSEILLQRGAAAASDRYPCGFQFLQ